MGEGVDRKGCKRVLDGRESDCVAEAAAGCRTAFAALIDRHYDRIYRTAWRFAGSREAAEDIAQDVCVKLATAIRQYRGEARFTTWLHAIVYTTATDFLRARQRIVLFAPSDLQGLAECGSSETPESALIDAQLWLAVRALPGQQRDAVLLVYAEDLTHAEAAVILGCTEKTVSWHLHEARKKLKVRLEAVGP